MGASAAPVLSASQALGLIALTCTATIIVECALAALIFRTREREDFRTIALAQIITNPVVELGCLALGWSHLAPASSAAWPALIALEVCACAVEALVYRSKATFEHPALASIILNIASFSCGIVFSAAL